MPKKSKTAEVKKLINLGKEKGFLTYDEVNDILPPDVLFSADQIDDLMAMFGEMDIDIIDDYKEVKVSKKKDLKDRDQGGGLIFQKDQPLGVINDPVRMYLKEMGAFYLLSREEEVKIANNIEKKKKEIGRLILKAPIVFKELINLSEKIRNERISIKDVVNTLDERDSETKEEFYRRRTLNLIDKIGEFDKENKRLEKILGDLGKYDHRKKEFKERVVKNRDNVAKAARKINLADKQIFKIVFA